QRKELRPAAFEHVRLQYELTKSLHFESPRLRLDTSGLMSVDGKTSLDLEMTYIMDGGRLGWGGPRVVVHQDRDRGTYVAAYRQAKPADDASKERRDRWEHMSKRDAEFNGRPGHDDNFTDFWIRTVAVADPAVKATEPPPMYEIVYSTDR